MDNRERFHRRAIIELDERQIEVLRHRLIFEALDRLDRVFPGREDNLELSASVEETLPPAAAEAAFRDVIVTVLTAQINAS